ncbi:DUF2497 domain-containing protein [Neorhizobium sp. NPDC001467]|uniref:PopZ family protein n=1 Tax=Neorhizobium sp. NPDC001467 TaxID=3390595 RepID=UPI003D048E47
MAQPSVAREPSMEEILASIRRIIESNEPVVEGSARRDFSDYNDDDGISDDAGDLAFVPDMAANDRGIPARDATVSRSSLQGSDFPTPLRSEHEAQTRQRTETEASPAAVPERSLSLADVAARVRAASSRAPEAPSEVAREPLKAAGEPASISQPQPQPVATASPRPLPRPVLPAIPELGVAGFTPDDAPAEPERMPRIVESAAEPTLPKIVFDEPGAVDQTAEAAAEAPLDEARAESLPAKIEAAANLMSAEAGAQVARSFGELADMLDGFNKQSVEEMAQDMLRPMLQEWLDYNLPTLVERLVREEIERVARGPRR